MKHTIQEENWRSQIINIIAKLDNGSHSSNQLQGADEALTELFASQLQSILSEVEKLPSYNMEVSSFGHTESALNREQVLSIISNRMGNK